jgi:hypothetical protein
VNEYLAACEALPKPVFGSLLSSGFPHASWDVLPHEAWGDPETYVSYRWDLIKRYAFAIPSDRAIAELARLSPLVEIGAGRGYWAYLLRQAGADVLAFDTYPPQYRDCGWWQPEDGEPWTEILRGGPERTARYPERTLFLCWPPYSSDMAARALRAYRGRTLAYVGEGAGGCTGDRAFHRQLARQWRLVKAITLPHWSGIYDDLMIYRRRTTHHE